MEEAFEKEVAPVTLWMRQLEMGCHNAAQPLWDHFCLRLRKMAKVRLGAKHKRSYDEEDAALSAFHSLCRAISVQKTRDLADRNDLWKFLVVITDRKIANRIRHEHRLKRNARRTVEETTVAGSEQSTLNSLIGREPTPEFVAEFSEICHQLLETLDDESLRQVASLKLDGWSAAEIADELGVSKRTIERRLLIVKRKWEAEFPEWTQVPSRENESGEKNCRTNDFDDHR